MTPHSCLAVEGFDLPAAVFLAHASHIAYGPNEGRPRIEDWAATQGFTHTVPFDHENNIQGYWTTSDEVALLVFRGTSNLGQWIRDARVLPASHPWGKVHVGFRNGVAGVEPWLKAFDEAAAKVRHVWVTGHSLGGALAVLAAARLKINGIDSRIYTYGQPRLGLFDFGERFDAELHHRCHRIVNQSDIVARLPPGLIYRHCGLVKHIVRPGVLEARGALASAPPEFDATDLPQVSEAEAERVAAAFDANPEAALGEGLQLQGRVPSIFKDHYMAEYIRLLTELRDQAA